MGANLAQKFFYRDLKYFLLYFHSFFSNQFYVSLEMLDASIDNAAMFPHGSNSWLQGIERIFSAHKTSDEIASLWRIP